MDRGSAFLAYKFTGEDFDELVLITTRVREWLKKEGYTDVFCSIDFEEFFSDNGYDYNRVLKYCTKEQAERDTFISLIYKEEPSAGMVQELDNSIELGQFRVLLIKKGLDFLRFRVTSDIVIEFESIDDLIEKKL